MNLNLVQIAATILGRDYAGGLELIKTFAPGTCVYVTGRDAFVLRQRQIDKVLKWISGFQHSNEIQKEIRRLIKESDFPTNPIAKSIEKRFVHCQPLRGAVSYES